MASVCEVCGKKPQFGMRLSHSHRRTKRRWNPNVQKVRAIVNGTPKRAPRLHLLPQGGQGRRSPEVLMQGVVRTYDPQTGEGVVVRDTDRSRARRSRRRARRLALPDAAPGSAGRTSTSTATAAPPGCASAPRPTWASPRAQV